jgi:hypothetical protein
MTWTTIRLELARTQDFPNGSAARSYVMRLPLGPDGHIDEQEYRHHPELATVRRFWPNQPDRHGCLLHTPNGWALSYEVGDDDDEALFRLETHLIAPGGYLTLTGPDGDRLPFVVKAMAAA